MPLRPDTTIGPYRVTAKIGEGGMGEVWQARDTKLDRDVALKVLPEAFTSDPDRLARFEREAKVRVSILVVALTLTISPRLAAQTANRQAGERTEVVVAGEQYGSPPGPTLFLGHDYRDLWTARIRVEVLDLGSVAGGLQPVMRVGGQASTGLALRGADGRDYTFRSVDQVLSETALPVEFRDSVLQEIVQDQFAATFPGAQVAQPRLAEAVGVLGVAGARLVVLPDDASLGEFREDFGGVLGVFLEYPQPRSAENPGFHGATEILGSDEFWDKRQASPDQLPDSRTFLRARFLDMFMNDWDRHSRQWRWARIPGEPLLQPIPEDPDYAFTDYEGATLGAARFMGAPFVTFEDEYPPLASITKNGWDVDRFILTDIERSEWMQIAADVQAKLTDAVIEEAISDLPAEYYQLRGTEIVSRLQQRRDKLTEYAEGFYRYMAQEVDVHGSNVGEIAVVEWFDGGDVQVTVAQANAGSFSSHEPYYRRRFTPTDTNEVRIYLHGGDDKVVIRGRKTSAIKIRAIGGPGDDVVDDSDGSGIRFYDSDGSNRIEGENGTHLDSREFTTVPRPEPNNTTWVPDPDWGRVTTPILAFNYSADPGLMLGAGLDTKGRGFRKYPWSSRHTLEGAWAFGAAKPFVDYMGAFRLENSDVQFALNARFSGIEQLGYYGLGNRAGVDPSNQGNHQMSAYQTEIFPALVLSKGARFAVGPYFQYSDSSSTDPDSILAQEKPLGFGEFGHTGLRAEVEFHSRNRGRDVFSPGVDGWARGAYNFKAWDAEEPFGSLAGRFGAQGPTGSRLVWSGFIGGEKVWGDFPFFKAAYIGHRTTTGYRWNRFAGDASLYGGVDLKVILARMRSLIPGDVGFDVFAEAGRVYLEGRNTDVWHPSYGLGLFYAPFERTSLYGLKFGRTD